MRQPPQRAHPKCVDHGCRSFNYLVCPRECELLADPPPDDEDVNGYPRSVLQMAPLVSIT